MLLVDRNGIFKIYRGIQIEASDQVFVAQWFQRRILNVNVHDWTVEGRLMLKKRSNEPLDETFFEFL